MVHLLLEHGADVYVEDNQGRTARDLVPDHGDKAEALKEYLYMWESESFVEPPRPPLSVCLLVCLVLSRFAYSSLSLL